MRQRSQMGAAGAAALGVAVLLLLLALPSEHGARGRRAVLDEDSYEWKHNEDKPQYNALADFDAGFSQGAWKPYESEDNVYSQLPGLEDEGKAWKPYEGDANVLADTPDVYPFDETKGGHEWNTYEGEDGKPDIKEFNVMDSGSQGLAEMDIGGANLPSGKKFKAFSPEKNVFQSLAPVDVPEGVSDHDWHHAAVKDQNVFAGNYKFPQGR
mmetsp:Transcript_22599/g.54220  ORF Transcript_22599/g.54220 Transcript_22599/m.54220 type:complete len:211 (-) Transcript_22599:75-707(-)